MDFSPSTSSTFPLAPIPCISIPFYVSLENKQKKIFGQDRPLSSQPTTKFIKRHNRDQIIQKQSSPTETTKKKKSNKKQNKRKIHTQSCRAGMQPYLCQFICALITVIRGLCFLCVLCSAGSSTFSASISIRFPEFEGKYLIKISLYRAACPKVSHSAL